MFTVNRRQVILTIWIGALALCLLALPVHAQMFSLWGDEIMSICEVHTTSPYQPFDIYVFLEPSTDGAFAAEYKMIAPPGHFATVITPNPVVSQATIGVWFGVPGISVPFVTCQTELFWIVRLTMMSPDMVPDFYLLGLNDDSQFMGVATCEEPMRPMVDGYLYNYFCFNQSCLPATEESSWGAIKDMYK